MATASAGRAALVTAGSKSSSFGQFRVTSFVADNVLKPNASNIQQTPGLFSSQRPNMEPVVQPRPSSGQNLDRTPSTAPSRPPPQDHNQPNSSPAGGALELVEVNSNPIIEGILGPNKDGRVRNPVPSKLKGKTDHKQGNFGVMHMGMSPGGKKTEAQGRDAAAERDAAARRTSENTASRAKAAQSEKYVPPKKRGLEASLGDPTANRGSPFAVSRDDHRQRARPLAPDETKFEQARLLTLLRSINPVTVVDQICKAVAYFGGIPGAPPPEDGIFPESANTRETGALFIGWLAEIFPDLSAKSPELPKDAVHGGGKKKGARPSKGKAATLGGEGPSNEPPNSRNGYGFGPAISAPTWGLPPSLALVNTPVPAIPIPLPDGRQGGSSSTEQSRPFEQPPPSTPSRQQPDELANSKASTSKRRRGRPKGSRNKGRSEGQQGSDGGVNNAQYDGNDQVLQPSQSPEIHAAVAKIAQPSQAPPEPAYVPTPDSQPPAISKQPPANQYPQQPWQTNSHQNPTGHSSHATSIPPTDELSPEERAVLEAFRNHGSEALNIVPSPIAPTKTAPEGGQKRKRAPPKPKPGALPAPSFPASNLNSVQNSGNLPPSGEAQAGVIKDAMQWSHVDTSTPTAPPAKRPRQRKPKAPSTNEPPSRTHTTSVVSSATPPTAPSTIPDSTASSSQQSLPVSRPPAEGLEAHYERFANLSNQQNGRSHTPTMVQQQQQSHRQQAKPTSGPPQQSTPQIQQQQMQTQKSQQGTQQGGQQGIQQSNQQGIQREDQKMAQATSARPSSTAYYNQRSQPSTTYSQQYPSHQPSQLYGTHQPSPQMSNNSYKTSSTHTLAQASPQFSQQENTYRTASPHSIAQPSPSFSQPDTNFRTNSTHSLAQPSPSFSQAETAYRAPSTHSMAQPSPAYTSSRAHSQTQPSHQNQYSHFSDSSYIDLPTLESLGHSGSSGTTNVSLSGGAYGQSIGVGLGASRSSASTNSLYGTSSNLSNAYDSGTSDLYRGVSRAASNNTAYGTTSSGLSNAFDEHLLRGMGRR
ncbi:hypothetical protein N431DRAFT_436040 [Stipitochalara longipes BDJ]|nr:hypothetical protein N431DRAFT_436040 [Stipitochalara longipes BDJ]